MKEKSKVIYLAGAISADNHFDFLKNLRIAFDFARRIIKMGHSVVVPHLDFVLFLDSNEEHILTEEEIKNNSFHIMQKCDEIWVLPNSANSKGVQKEIEWWAKNGKEDKIKWLGEKFKNAAV